MSDTCLRVELLHPKARLPHKAHASDACFDLYLPEDASLEPGETKALDTGIAIQLEEGWEAQVRGRSGLAKRGLLVYPGTIDHLYRRNLWVLVHNLSREPFAFRAGERVAQLKVSRVWQVEVVEAKVEATERGGLGSTGK